MRRIPKKYLFKGSSEKGGSRTLSPFFHSISNLPLEELECPCCGKKELHQGFVECMMAIGTYYIDCDNCDWQAPVTTEGSDCGENILEFKHWLEAFELIGRPKSMLKEELNFWFYPEGEWRDKVKAEYLRNNLSNTER